MVVVVVVVFTTSCRVYSLRVARVGDEDGVWRFGAVIVVVVVFTKSLTRNIWPTG